MKFNLKHAVLGLALAGAFTSANATSISPGQEITPVDMASFFGGTLIDSVTSSVTTSTFSGTAYSAVYATDSGYDFYYQFVNDASSDTAIGRLTGFDFSDFTTDAFQTDDAFGIFVAGDQQSTSVTRDEFGVVGFNFSNTLGKVDPGQASFTQIIRTNANFYVPGTFAIINGSATDIVAFAPAVPEPETYAMMLAGLGLIGFIGRRRLNRSTTNFA